MNNILFGIIVLSVITLTISIIALVKSSTSHFENKKCDYGPHLTNQKPKCLLIDHNLNSLKEYEGNLENNKCKYSINKDCDCPDNNNFYNQYYGKGTITKDREKKTCTLNNVNMGNSTVDGGIRDIFDSNNPCAYYNTLYASKWWKDSLVESQDSSCTCSSSQQGRNFANVVYYKYNPKTSMCEVTPNDDYDDCYHS